MSSDTDKLMHLSLLLKAIDDCDQELVEFKAEHKARREKLQTELAKLRWEVLSGQERLPLEPIPAPAIIPVMEAVADQVNSGILNTPGVTVTAEVRNAPDGEASVEERARTRKQAKKAEGQIQ